MGTNGSSILEDYYVITPTCLNEEGDYFRDGIPGSGSLTLAPVTSMTADQSSSDSILH